MSYQKLIAKINENTYKCTDFYDFAEPFEVFEKKLNVDVTPLLEEIDFYKGGRIIIYDYVPESSRFQKYLGRERESGIKRETHLVELFNNFKQGHICFVGPAGSGKSTLMKATSRNAMQGKYFQGTIKMVSYIQCKQFMKNRKVTAGELIFNDLPKEERGQAIDYAKTHPEEVLFMLDSLDTLQYTVDGVYEIISLDEPAYPEVIVWNFLTGKLFPGCRILSSSREHSIRNYWGEVRPDKVIALAGLTMESIKEIISGYEGNVEAEKIMEFLKIKAPLRLLLCTTPVMLVYTLIALKFKSDFKPNTITGIMTVVMQSILRSSHTHQENIIEVLGKLKELSYIGTVERRVLFTENDFRQVNLKPEEATDLAILAPGGIYRKLLQGIHLLYFQHQSIQEMLTSFYILGLDLKSFDQFVDKHLHTGHFVLIRKMMCGLLLNPTVYEEAGDLLGEIKDVKEKRDILKKSLQLQLEQLLWPSRTKSDLLEFFTVLNEAKDGMSDIVKSSLNKIHMSEHPLSISDAHVIGTVASYCTSLEMNFNKCDLKSASLQTLASGLKGSNVKIKDLRLIGNENMGVGGLSSVGQILSNQSCVELLNIGNCNLSSDQLQAFKSSLGNNTEIKWLYLGGNTSMGVEGLSSVGQILSNQSCVELLNLQKCNLSPDQLQAFKSSLGNNTEIDHLDMSEGIFEQRIANHEDIVAVANLLPNVTKQLRLIYWNITYEDEKILQNQLNEIGSEKLEIKLSGRKTLKSQRKPADEATNVTLKQNPTLSSESEFGTTSRLSKSESTEENVEISKEVKSPRSELLMTEKGAEQSDKEVTEQAAKPAQHSLSQIENVSSQRSGSDILLTWNEVPDSNVLYNIEIFCDDVKLGETHTTEISQYRMKSPILGKTYRFQVWAKDKWGNSGLKTQSKNVIKSENIEVVGGSMRLNECKVTFPSGTFGKQTKVWMSVGIDNSICPEEYIGITPVFDISADSQFLKDAIVQIQSWCVGLEKDKIDILHFSSKTDWDIINPDRITENNSIEFRCKEFSPFTVAIKWLLWLLGKQEVIVDNCLYILNRNELHFTFFNKCDTAETKIRSHFRELGAQLAPIWFNPFSLKTDDRLRLELQIDQGQEDLRFNMPHEEFVCNNIFLTAPRHNLTFRLLPNLQEYPERLIVCRVLKNDVLHEMKDFVFPLQPAGGNRPGQQTTIYYGDFHVDGNMNMMEQGNNRQQHVQDAQIEQREAEQQIEADENRDHEPELVFQIAIFLFVIVFIPAYLAWLLTPD
ncbi:uncharacterized protein LOC120332063 [Styela clava]